MRGRSWRRYREEVVLKRRLSNALYINGYWRGFFDANNLKIDKPTIASYVMTDNYFRFKTHTTTNWDSRVKDKYSPNKRAIWYRKSTINTREYDKKEFNRIMEEYYYETD